MPTSTENSRKLGHIYLSFGSKPDLVSSFIDLTEEDGNLNTPYRARIIDKSIRQFSIGASFRIHVECYGQRGGQPLFDHLKGINGKSPKVQDA